MTPSDRAAERFPYARSYEEHEKMDKEYITEQFPTETDQTEVAVEQQKIERTNSHNITTEN